MDITSQFNQEEEWWKDVAITGVAEMQQRRLSRFQQLNDSGLPLENALTLLRTWSQAASVHLLRHASVSTAWAVEVDAQCVQTYESLIQSKLTLMQKMELFLEL